MLSWDSQRLKEVVRGQLAVVSCQWKEVLIGVADHPCFCPWCAIPDLLGRPLVGKHRVQLLRTDHWQLTTDNFLNNFLRLNW
jgi:hypothetical protein